MAERTEITVEDCLKGAWEAVLNEDYEERDKLIAMAERCFNGNESIPKNTPVPFDKDGMQ